jgi:hypothetical protein
LLEMLDVGGRIRHAAEIHVRLCGLADGTSDIYQHMTFFECVLKRE